MMQPLLLLKQTLEASYDPGPILLDGPNVKLTSVDQILPRSDRNNQSDSFEIGIGSDDYPPLSISYSSRLKKRLHIQKMVYGDKKDKFTLSPEVAQSKMLRMLSSKSKDHFRKRKRKML